MKKVISILIAIIITANFSTSALAANIQPRWTDVATITNTLTISNDTATMNIYVRAYNNIKRVEVTAYLQKYIYNGNNSYWDTIKTYNLSNDNYYLIWNDKYSSVNEGYTYRLFSKIKVYEKDDNSNYILKEYIERIHKVEY